MTYEFRIDEGGYIYLLDRNGKRVDVLVDVPNCQYYGKLKLERTEDEDGTQMQVHRIRTRSHRH